MNTFRFLFALSIFFLHIAKNAEAGTRSCRIIFPERPSSAPKEACIFDGKNSRRVTLPSMNFSDVIDLPPGNLTIVMTQEPINDRKDIPPDAPILSISDKLIDFYIIITADSQNRVFPIKMNMINTGDGKLNPGDTLWYNLSDHRILAKLGEKQMSVAPKSSTITSNPIPSSGYYDAIFAYQAFGRGPQAPITEQQWWHDAASRHLGFIVNTGGKLPKICVYRDFRSPSEPTNPTKALSNH